MGATDFTEIRVPLKFVAVSLHVEMRENFPTPFQFFSPIFKNEIVGLSLRIETKVVPCWTRTR